MEGGKRVRREVWVELGPSECCERLQKTRQVEGLAEVERSCMWWGMGIGNRAQGTLSNLK